MPISFGKQEYIALLGHPVAENPSGVMQEAAFAQAGLNWRYLAFDILPDHLGAVIAALRVLGFRGANCTLPHKETVGQYLDRLAPDATRIGAVNTIRFEDDRLIGENTDGKGFLRALAQDGQVEPMGRRFVLLGAGGAARAVAFELAARQPKQITIVNRTTSRGETLARDLANRAGASVESVPWHGPFHVPPDCDVLVNCTSIGLYPQVDDLPAIALDSLRPSLLVCDIVPNPPRTRLLGEAAARGCRTLDGLSMLIYQGAIGFEMWTGQRPSLPAMREALHRVFRI